MQSLKIMFESFRTTIDQTETDKLTGIQSDVIHLYLPISKRRFHSFSLAANENRSTSLNTFPNKEPTHRREPNLKNPFHFLAKQKGAVCLQ